MCLRSSECPHHCTGRIAYLGSEYLVLYVFIFLPLSPILMSA